MGCEDTHPSFSDLLASPDVGAVVLQRCDAGTLRALLATCTTLRSAVLARLKALAMSCCVGEPLPWNTIFSCMPSLDRLSVEFGLAPAGSAPTTCPASSPGGSSPGQAGDEALQPQDQPQQQQQSQLGKPCLPGESASSSSSPLPAACGALPPRLRRLSLRGAALDDGGAARGGGGGWALVRALVAAPHWPSLTHLRLAGCGLDNAAARSLARAARVAGGIGATLRHLDLSDNPGLCTAGLQALLPPRPLLPPPPDAVPWFVPPAWSALPAWTRGGDGDGGIDRGGFPRLRSLALERCGLPSTAVGVLAYAALSELKELHLSGNVVGDRGCTALLTGEPNVGKPTTVGEFGTGLLLLDLSFNGIGDEGVKELSQGEWLAGLRCLNLAGNRIGDSGARALARAAQRCAGGILPRMARLCLASNRIGDAGAMEVSDIRMGGGADGGGADGGNSDGNSAALIELFGNHVDFPIQQTLEMTTPYSPDHARVSLCPMSEDAAKDMTWQRWGVLLTGHAAVSGSWLDDSGSWPNSAVSFSIPR